MNIFQIFTYAAIVDKLNAGYPVLMSHLSLLQWRELSFYMVLQFENGNVYAAAPDNGSVGLLDSERTRNSMADDLYFDVSRDHMFKQGRLQR